MKNEDFKSWKGNLAGVLFGFIIVPVVVVFFFWILDMHTFGNNKNHMPLVGKPSLILDATT